MTTQQYMRGTLLPLLAVVLFLAVVNLCVAIWSLAKAIAETSIEKPEKSPALESVEIQTPPPQIWQPELPEVAPGKPGNSKAGAAWVNGRRVW